MAVIAMTSLSGAPGVTTAATAWAMNAERATLVIEADPVGGSPILAGAFGSQMSYDTSILNLGILPAGMSLMDRLHEQQVAFPDCDDAWLIPAPSQPGQASSLQPRWHSIGRAAQELSDKAGMDVLIDLGRWCSPQPAAGLLPQIDLMLVFVRADLPGVHVLHQGLANLRQALQESSESESPLTRVGLVSLEADHDSIAARTLTNLFSPQPLLGTLPYTPSGVRPWRRGTPVPQRSVLDRFTKADQSASYVSSIQSLATRSREHAQAYTAALTGDLA